ncbi:MAG: Ni/Fe-hydrogenase, b-type cytochrome subunit [Thermodesulfobacteriota bacterium]
MAYQKIKVWSVLLRLFHWSFAGAIVVLVTTGTYINTPWTNTLLLGQDTFPMATMRYIHFLAGVIFSCAILIRIYLLLFGRRHERLLDFAPFTGRVAKKIPGQLRTYLYLREFKEGHLGHNPLAGMAYLTTFFLALGQIISGFYLLYPESATWQWLGLTLFGPQQQARNIHHALMWYFIIFVLVHLYLVIWNEIKASDGLISSMFSGKKYKKDSN